MNKRSDMNHRRRSLLRMECLRAQGLANKLSSKLDMLARLAHGLHEGTLGPTSYEDSELSSKKIFEYMRVYLQREGWEIPGPKVKDPKALPTFQESIKRAVENNRRYNEAAEVNKV